MMAAEFNIQKPYVLTTLPRPLNQAGTDRISYAVGDVWGQHPDPGSKKRKRPELAIGIDGEAVNIFDVPASRLITSYPIPPQSSFTCPPYSVRWRFSKSKDVARYTYISTRDPAPKITLFKDELSSSGDTRSSSVSVPVDHGAKIVSLSTTSATSSTSSAIGMDKRPIDTDVIAVTEDGSVLCFQGEDLQKRWQTSPEILKRDLTTARKISNLQVELVQQAQASDVIAGLFNGKQDAFGAFLHTVQNDSFNPDMLILVTRAFMEGGAGARHLHVFAIMPPSDAQSKGRLVQIHTAPIPSQYSDNASADFRVDVGSGALMERCKDRLLTYDLTGNVVKVASRLQIPAIQSFLRLSKSFLLAATPLSLHVYNPIFRSIQASTAVSLQGQPLDSSENVAPPKLSLVAYFARLEIAVALNGTSLVAVQLEAPRTRDRKRRAEGLLIDSIGRGIPGVTDEVRRRKPQGKSTVFSNHLPGSITGTYWSEFTEAVQEADKLFATGDLAGLEELLASKLGIKTRPAKQEAGTQDNIDEHPASPDQKEHRLPEWIWPPTRSEYPLVDRRWILYAISRVFSWQDATDATSDQTRLVCRLPESNILSCLADAGYLTVSNLKSALKDEVRDVDDIDYILGEEITRVLVQVDPLFELLLSYLSSTMLGAVELLTAIRLIMRSLELVQDPTKIAPKLLTFESQKSDPVQDDGATAENGDIGMELDRLEHDLEVTEYYLGDASTMRARGLSVAFGKLGGCPQASTIRVLRRSYKPEEILSLIYVLRMELVKDGWTTRYLDTSRLDEDDDLEPPPDGSIQLIADLLCRCIDAVGPAGWLINDAIVASGAGDHVDSADFLTSLKLEVSAALEGVQEAVFLRGIVSEAVRFGTNQQKASGLGPKRAVTDDSTALTTQPSEQSSHHRAESAMLPLGMKAHSRISAEKIVSGGEVVKRRKREVGHLISKRVGAYSLERIAI